MDYQYDGHGHSLCSDGSDTPGAIVSAAVHRGIDILGLSDHDTVAGLPAFVDACKRANKETVHILPIPSVEVTTSSGHLLVALPFEQEASRFIRHFPQWNNRPEPLDVIRRCMYDYRAVCIFLHPEEHLIGGFSLTTIGKLIQELPSEVHRYLGIETRNWMAQVFFWHSQQVTERILKQNAQWKLAPFAFTDYHRARHVGNHRTSMQMHALSADAFVEAVRRRDTLPLPSPISARTLWETYTTIASADAVHTLKSVFNLKERQKSSPHAHQTLVPSE